jgi:hypothetical protein
MNLKQHADFFKKIQDRGLEKIPPAGIRYLQRHGYHRSGGLAAQAETLRNRKGQISPASILF